MVTGAARSELSIVLEGPVKAAGACGDCLEPYTGTCGRCGGPACAEDDECMGCHRLICRACDLMPTLPFSFEGDAFWHPHNEAGT